jgi:hypothetical protein
MWSRIACVSKMTLVFVALILGQDLRIRLACVVPQRLP